MIMYIIIKTSLQRKKSPAEEKSPCHACSAAPRAACRRGATVATDDGDDGSDALQMELRFDIGYFRRHPEYINMLLFSLHDLMLAGTASKLASSVKSKTIGTGTE